MLVTVLGIRKVSFDSDDGKHVSGKTIFYGFEQAGVDGLVCDKAFISSEKLKDVSFATGDTVDFAYNRFGKVDTVTKA